MFLTKDTWSFWFYPLLLWRLCFNQVLSVVLCVTVFFAWTLYIVLFAGLL